jgi:hypothetical protein
MWETLSRARYANEKLAWDDGNISSDETFYTPLRSHVKERTNNAQLLGPKIHLEVDSHLHCTIVKQLETLKLTISSSQSSAKTKSSSSS